MPVFLTIGYGDRNGYERTPREIRDRAHAQDANLAAEGAVMGVAGPPVQARNPEAAGVVTETGPFLSSELPVAGCALIEADDIEDAVRKVAYVPCAVAHGVVEVWPIG